MRKKQKHPRLPNGFGSIRYLGAHRTKPYQVRASANGEILAYVDDWYKGFTLLTAYNAHTWHPGDDVEDLFIDASEGLDGLVRRLVEDYRHISGKRYVVARQTTFKDVVDRWYVDKYENDDKRKYSESTKANINKGIGRLGPIYDRPFSLLRLEDLQAAVDEIDAPTMQEAARMVLHGVYAYGLAHDLVEKDYSLNIRIDHHVRKTGQPFTKNEVKRLWKLRGDPEAEMLLIMIYSGFRISAYADMEVNLDKRYFKGGVKTDAGKDRIVPIHHAILPLVRKRMSRYGCLIPGRSVRAFGYKISNWCRDHNMDHTPHHTRHTFSMLCEKYEVKENDRKRLLGHQFKDVTNEVYGHRDLEDLRREIEKIPIVDEM